MAKKKKWPIDLIRRGLKGDSKIIWWQEPEQENGNGAPIVVPSAAAARSIGYEAHTFVPVAYSEKLATVIEDFLKGRIEADDLKAAVESYRDFVEPPANNPRGR